jgi:hypothetical protein
LSIGNLLFHFFTLLPSILQAEGAVFPRRAAEEVDAE